ncbi:MAG: hypothetical protein VB108_04190 [Anaerolineaceae bacterium]|nr:hypothetical protein [Anaerolineaceae bacterium]
MKKLDMLGLGSLCFLSLAILFLSLYESHKPISAKLQEGLNASAVSPQGGLTIEFSKPVESRKTEEAFLLEPDYLLNFDWLNARSLRLHWVKPIPAGTKIRLTLKETSIGQNGERSLPQVWDLGIRMPRILLKGADPAHNELFSLDPINPADLRQLTHTKNRLFDFTVSAEVSTYYYTVLNDLHGTSLWSGGRDGQEQKEIINFDSQFCYSPSVNNNEVLLLTCQNRSAENGEVATKLWLVYPSAGKANPLFSDPSLKGELGKWSPDGQWISYYERENKVLVALNPEVGQSFRVEMGGENNGSWSPDSRFLYYPSQSAEGFGFNAPIMKLDLQTGLSSPAIPAQTDADAYLYDYLTPHPQNDWIALAASHYYGITGNAVLLLNQKTHAKIFVSEDISRFHSQFKWSPDGQNLLFQSSALQGQGQPEIWIWNLKDNLARKIIDQFLLPAWMP